MLELIATLITLQVNLYRVENNLPVIPQDIETCEYASYRLHGSKEEFSHEAFREIDHRTAGIWYENLGRIIKDSAAPLENSQAVLQAWKESPTHNKNLIANMDTMCVKTDGINFVFIAHGKEHTSN